MASHGDRLVHRLKQTDQVCVEKLMQNQRPSAHFSYPTMILRQMGVFCCRSETNSPIKAESHANMSSDDP